MITTEDTAPAGAALDPPQEVRVGPIPPQRLREVLAPGDWEEFERGIVQARAVLDGRVVWMVNSTAVGGGVAEMLHSFLAYTRGAGVNVRWMVMTGTPDFFRITKRIHNMVHGSAGDGGPLGDAERAVFEAVGESNAEQVAGLVRPEDIVLLHDPQTAAMVPRMKATGAHIVWRSHIGAERATEPVHAAWAFLGGYLKVADACIFSRHSYVPEWANALRTEIIQPSIDVFSPKNQELDERTVQGILAHVGLVVDHGADLPPTYTREDGTPGRVDRMCEVLSTGPPPSTGDPLVVQVSRWDRLKDHMGVMLGFAEHVVSPDAHLVLAGPNVTSVADDPEGAEVLEEVAAAWRGLPHTRRGRVHLACLPMADIEENAAIVNALQRHATIVVQKSLAEGFGLTVAEAMWKARPVVASAVGGIQDQIEDGVTGLLLEDATDLAGLGERITRLLDDPPFATGLGLRAREEVRSHFLANRHAMQYVRLFAALIQARADGAG